MCRVSKRHFSRLTTSYGCRATSLVAVVLLSGCSVTGHSPANQQLCVEGSTEHWQELRTPPPGAEEMMKASTGERTVGEVLSIVPDNRSTAWFLSSLGVYRYCRYVAKVDSCRARIETVDFSLIDGRWQADHPMEQICVSRQMRHGQPIA
jgi:hypothetical protein